MNYLRRTYSGLLLALRSETGFEYTVPGQGHAVESCSRQQELKRRTKVMPSMATLGYWKLGAIGCQGASWGEQLDGKELRGEYSRFMGTVSMGSLPSFNYYIVVCCIYCVALLLM